MPANMKFSLLFIRPEAAFGSGSTDDVATIKPTEGGQFTLAYLYRNAGQRQKTKQTLEASDVFRWLRTTLGLLQLDSDPFATLQLDMTGLPTLLFDVKEISSRNNRVYNVLLDALEFFLEISQETGEVPSTLSDTKFTAYLNRRDGEKPDFFKIQATPAADQFVLTYKDAGVPEHTLLLSRKATEEWAGILTELLATDTDPFESLQLSATGFPDVILRVAELTLDQRLRRYFDASAERFLDTLNFFLNTVERPAESFIPVPRLDTSNLNVTRYFAAQDAQTMQVDEEDTESEESEDSDEEDSLESEAYSTDSEDEYADMPPLISAKQLAMDEYAAYRNSTWAPKNKHLFFDEDGDVIMGY